MGHLFLPDPYRAVHVEGGLLPPLDDVVANGDFAGAPVLDVARAKGLVVGGRGAVGLLQRQSVRNGAYVDTSYEHGVRGH